MRVLVSIVFLFASSWSWSQCFLDSTKIIGTSNLSKQEEQTASYYCISRVLSSKDTISKTVDLAVKQYLFSTIGNALYKKIKLKGIEITDWSLQDRIYSDEPSKAKCKHIKYIYTFAIVFEDWIEYVLTIPVTENGKVVLKGFVKPQIDISKDLKVKTYCGALSLLDQEIGETISTIGAVSIDYIAKKKCFEWIFTQTKKRVPIQRNIQDLAYATVEYQYYQWRVSTLDGSIEKIFITEQD